MKRKIFIVGLAIVICFLGLTACSKVQSKDKINKNIEIVEQESKKQFKNSLANRSNKHKQQYIEYIKKDPKEVYIPILMYHSISDANPKNNLLVPPKQFREQIQWLKENNFTPLLMEEVIEVIKTGKVPKKPVAITFDDGYRDNYTDAYKILKENNMKGTFFVITNCISGNKEYMTLDMLREMKDNGMGIENHTHNHLELPRESKKQKIESIKEAQKFLKKNLSIDSKYLCYPVGKYDLETIEVAKFLGIEGAVTTKGGFANINQGQYSLKRIRISPMDIDSFKKVFVEYTK